MQKRSSGTFFWELNEATSVGYAEPGRLPRLMRWARRSSTLVGVPGEVYSRLGDPGTACADDGVWHLCLPAVSLQRDECKLVI